jgi:hypothetical protein
MTRAVKAPAVLDTVLMLLYTTALMVNSDAGQVSSSNKRMNARTRSISLWAAALIVIVVGFADLARGGTTIAPVLLVLGYCVLVPIAILK